MHISKNFCLLTTIALLTGCGALQIQVMSRENGNLYKGSIQGNGWGSGTITLPLENKVCTGPYAKGATNDSFGFFQTYGAKGGTSVGSMQNYSGSSTVKALLSCTDGTGLRCDFVGGGGTGTGICVDSKDKVYDAIVM